MISQTPAPINQNPRVELKLRIPLNTVNAIKRILQSGQYKSPFLNDFCSEAIVEKLGGFQDKHEKQEKKR